MSGGFGADGLTVGVGSDSFVVTSATALNIDTISDFNIAEVTIELENAIFTSLTTQGALSAADIVKGRAAVDASDRVIYISATGALLYDSNGNAAGGSFQYRRRALLPLDDRLYSLQPTISHRTRSSLLRCLQHHGISRLPEVEGGRADKKKFKTYPIDYFHI